jgi:hypothetical protein
VGNFRRMLDKCPKMCRSQYLQYPLPFFISPHNAAAVNNQGTNQYRSLAVRIMRSPLYSPSPLT